jgi:hypothetical protein
MNKFTFTKIFLSVFFLSTLAIGEIFGQGTPWNGFYGNNWLEGKYDQKWLRIGVNTRGIQRVTLPGDFLGAASPANLKLYYRGVEVAIISASSSEIQFYGVRNDGSSDALLYRPTSSRVNPYYSMYSDESSYFLTIGNDAGKRATVENIINDASATVLDYHIQKTVTTYQTEYTHATWLPIRPGNLNSFLEDGQTRTGARLVTSAANPVFSGYNVVLRKPFGAEMPEIKVLVHGRSNYIPNGSNPRNVHVYVGKTAATLREVASLPIEGFKYAEHSFVPLATDLNATGGMVGFSLDSPLQGLSWDRFSVSYLDVTYKQEIDMGGAATYYFSFPGAAQSSKSKISVKTPPAGTLKFYDISDPANVRVINGTAASVIFSRINDQSVNLLATTATVQVDPGKVTSYDFQPINRANFDYLIVTNKTLLEASNKMATYRSTETPGKKYKTGVFEITDLYNQFNYGEPSPLAIRRFVDYMIADGNKDRYLLLMGKSITRNDKITKELPDEVPTWGFPGSDLLLVEGLQGTDKDVPAIPFGRIPAINLAQAANYLQKVKSYETTTTGLGWRKRVAHLSGGKSDSEIDDHAFNLANVASKVTNPSFGGTVVSYKKPVATSETIQMDELYKQVNTQDEGGAGGVGLITYFGHSSPYQTDFNFGYVSDVDKNFANPGRYPVMFYNGCDILNVFSGNFDETVNLPSSRPQSLDWLLAENRGAIAVFGNSWSGYASSCNEYLKKIYAEVFDKSDQNRLTLGQIIKVVAQQTKSSAGYRVGFENARLNIDYNENRAQVHQTMVLGDPALKILLSAEGGLPVELISFDAKVSGSKRVDVSWKTSSEVNNSHFVLERSYNAKNFEEIGRVEGRGDSNIESTYSFIDNDPLPGTSYYRLKQVDFSVKGSDGKMVDGKSTLSRTVSVFREGTELLTVYPNPAHDFTEITLDAPVKIGYWNVIDLKGGVKKTGKGNRADFSGLMSGEYILKIVTDNSDIYYRKVIKK